MTTKKKLFTDHPKVDRKAKKAKAAPTPAPVEAAPAVECQAPQPETIIEAKAPETPKKPKAPKATRRVAKDVSMSARLREFVCADPKQSVDQLLEKLVAAGFASANKVTVSTLRNDALATLRAARAAGLISVDV
jgi:hypothetical protein